MKRIGIVAALLVLSGCAAGIDGFDQKVAFDSAPSGALVNVAWLDQGQPRPLQVDGSCTTPCVLPIDRDRSYKVTFTKAGCAPADLRLYPTHSQWYFPLVSALPDSVTGRTYDLKPVPARATLSCGTGT
jgi:hypothetical protein